MEDPFETARTRKTREKFLTTGCQKFDKLLQGGITNRGITQIYGAAGTGKTQLALQLCLTVQLPLVEGGLDADMLPFDTLGAAYICTESCFPSRRLQELIQKLEATNKYKINGDLIFVEHVSTMEEVEQCLLHRIPILMSARKIGLIVLDSVAAPYRVEDWKDVACNRAKSLRIVGQQLHKLCRSNDIFVLCINQVTAVLDNNLLQDDSKEQPALGATWLSMMTTSIYFRRINNLRYACIKLSSSIPEINIPFEIHGSGVQAIDKAIHGET